jgi:hypothetical protein
LFIPVPHAQKNTIFFIFFSYSSFSKLFTIHIISQLTSLYDAREFSNERGRVERRAQFHKCRSRQMFTEAMSAYLNWITQAGVSFCFTFSIVYISIRTILMLIPPPSLLFNTACTFPHVKSETHRKEWKMSTFFPLYCLFCYLIENIFQLK